MAGGGLSFPFLVQDQRVSCGSDPFFVSRSCLPFLGSRSLMNFNDVHGGNRTSKTFLRPFTQFENGDEELDDYLHHPSKKRRLTDEQIKNLEKNFEDENMLEPERKIQLAKELGLQPRQVAIWFQNRRARWKTKQLEKDYDKLQASYNSLKADYDKLQLENDKLKTKVNEVSLKFTTFWYEICLMIFGVRFSTSKEKAANLSEGSVAECKAEEFSSTKSDTFRCNGGDTSYVFELDQSDISQDEEDNSTKNMLPSYVFPELEEGNYSDPPTDLCNFGVFIEDNAFWTWSY